MTAYGFIKNNVSITVFDTPGLADATSNDDEYLRKIKETESDFDLFLFCTEMNNIRFRTDDLETMTKLTQTLGPQLWDHAVVVLTFANEVHASPSKKAKDITEKDVFNNRLLGFKKKIKQELIKLDIPEEVAVNVPFVPTGDSSEPKLPDRNNWLTAFWVAAFKRINRNAKAAFLVANADRIAFSSILPSDEENTESGETDKDDDHASPSSGLSTEEVMAIRALKHKLQEVSFELERSLLKPRPYDETGNTSTTSQNPVVKVSKVSQRSSIEMDETSSQGVVKEMIGDVTGQFVGELTNAKFGRYYQTFFNWLIRYVKKKFVQVPAIKEKPEKEKPEKEKNEDYDQESE